MFVLYTPWVSPHQIPLAKELVKILGVDEFRYFYTEDPSPHQLKWGWDKLIAEPWIEKVFGDDARLRSCETLLSGIRDQNLLDARAFAGLRTFYMSERWLKPIRLGGAAGIGLPFLGGMKLLIPSYRHMVKRFVKWANGDPGARVLAIGPWAKKDFLWMGVREEKIVDWGYFVAPSGRGSVVDVEGGSGTEEEKISKSTVQLHTSTRPLKVLWAGRDLALKRVKDIERAVEMANRRLGGGRRGSATGTRASPLPVTFTKLTGVTPEEVRAAMREHDVFVFASNGYEGWGAVVSEALEEGMNVIGTLECGSCPMLLPVERLYHCGDVRALAKLLVKEYNNELPSCSIGDWTAAQAAEKLVKLVES